MPLKVLAILDLPTFEEGCKDRKFLQVITLLCRKPEIFMKQILKMIMHQPLHGQYCIAAPFKCAEQSNNFD